MRSNTSVLITILTILVIGMIMISLGGNTKPKIQSGIQKTAVIEYNDLVNATNLINKTNKFQVLYFEQTYF